MIREHFLEEDAFGQGGAGNGECRGQSRVAGTTGWLLPGGGGVEVRDRDGGARPAGRGNLEGAWGTIEGDLLLCCDGGGGKTANSFCFWSRHSDVKRPGQGCSFPGLPTKPQNGSFRYRHLPLPGLEAGNPRSEQGWSSRGCSPRHADDGRLLPASSQGCPSVYVCVLTFSSHKDPQSCGMRAQPSDPITLFTSVEVTPPNSCVLAAGGQDSNTGLCRLCSAHSSGGGRGDVRAPAPLALTPLPGGCAQGAPGSHCALGPSPTRAPRLRFHPRARLLTVLLGWPRLNHRALSFQAPLGHAELHGPHQAGPSPGPPAQPSLLVPALRVPGMSAAH